MLNFVPAQLHLEIAVRLAEKVDSWHWRRVASGALASNYIAQADLERADVTLNRALPPGTPARMLGQRIAWCSRIELALARGTPDLALQYAEQLLTDVPDSARGRPILRVYKLYGHVLTALGRLTDAEEKYQNALHMAESHQARTEHWRILAALGRLYHQIGDATKSDQAFTAARTMVEGIAGTINDLELRSIMLTGLVRYLSPDTDIWLL